MKIGVEDIIYLYNVCKLRFYKKGKTALSRVLGKRKEAIRIN